MCAKPRPTPSPPLRPPWPAGTLPDPCARAASRPQLTGVQIKVSGREDVVPGTNNRKVTLTGPAEGVQIAQFIISKKVQESAAEH